MKWRFSPQLQDQVETEITQRDQFNNDEVDLSETIVREAIQNSLDAAIEEKVRVTFRWMGLEQGLTGDYFRKLLDGQLEHARAAEIDVDSLGFSTPTALCIEDFGTSGLTGKVNQKDDDNFSDFWRRHGKSHKTGKSRGRWGLGKLVYSGSSQVGAFFGVTKRTGDPGVYLMGQTVLNLRKVNGKEYPPHGFFADLEHESDIQRRISVPVCDQAFVDEFIDIFRLERRERPGLSIVIPFPNQRFDPATMIRVAIENYFYPLVTGQLELIFDSTVINRRNVRELARKYPSKNLPQVDLLFDFIEQASQAKQGEMHRLPPSWSDDKRLDAEDLPADVLESIRQQFASGQLVGLYLPVTLRPKSGDEQYSGFNVFIQRPAELERGLDLYVRGGLTVPKEAKFGDRRAYGALIAEEEPICAFLGDAENAAHTIWTTNTEKLRRNYRSSQNTVTVIKNAVVQLYDLLAEVADDADEDALQAFFWFDDPDPGQKQSKKKKRSARPEVPELPRTAPLLQLHRIEGGFSLVSSESFSPEQTPREVKIRLAYEVARGNAFKKYSPLDFRLGKSGNISMSVSSNDDVKVVSADNNEIVLQILKVPFKVTAKGFDENRDLKVRIQS
jgi:hypothetical protein